MEFFQTPMGRKFFEGTLPRIAAALEGIQAELEALNRRQAAAIDGEGRPVNDAEQ